MSGTGPGDVVTLDLSQVKFIDSTGVSMLLKFKAHLDVMGCRVTFVDPSVPVVRVLTRLTNMCPTEYGPVVAT